MMVTMGRWTRRAATAYWALTSFSTARRGLSVAHASSSSSSLSSSLSLSLSSLSSCTKFRTLQVQVVHRHGDRTPITPMKDEAFWASQLIPPDQIAKIAQYTHIVREPGKEEYVHAAGGKGVFGKLTELGLLQMIRVGLNLKEQLLMTPTDKVENQENNYLLYSPLFDTKERGIPKDSIRVFSTDFPRTIQSVQGLLLGLLDNNNNNNKAELQEEEEEDFSIPIDVRHTTMMIPDPQPRQTKEQEHLEHQMSHLPHILQAELEYMPLAAKATKALHPLLGEGAHEVDFGVVQEHPEDVSIEVEPLAWNQLAEITKCLSVRNRLPPELSKDDVESILKHTAWRWFQSMQHPRLIYLAMHQMLDKQLHFFKDHVNQPKLIIWSAHDSTLIGLLCAYRLSMPAVWPEYSSVLLMELVEMQEEEQHNGSGSGSGSGSGTVSKKQLGVRFSLNGERLQSLWNGPQNPLDIVPLDFLLEKVATEGAKPETERVAS